jgi:transposase
MKSISAAKVNHILSLLDSGKDGYAAARCAGVSPSTISRIHKKHRSSLQKSLGGRPSKLSPANIHHAHHLIISGKAKNAGQLTKPLANIINQPLSTWTMRCALKKAGMVAVKKRKRPFLSARHRRERLDWALTHQHWTVEDWRKVVYSDESKINRFGSDGDRTTWKMKGEGLSDRLVEGTLKFGGCSLMVWGCMMWEGVGNLVKIDGKMDTDLYQQIMEDDLLGSLDWYDKSPREIIFQQDGDPKHRCLVCRGWYQDHAIDLLPWPAQSADLAPIEHLWSHLKKKLKEYDHPAGGILELWERVEKEWNKIQSGVVQNLIESMPKRVAAVIKAKGGYTKY